VFRPWHSRSALRCYSASSLSLTVISNRSIGSMFKDSGFRHLDQTRLLKIFAMLLFKADAVLRKNWLGCSVLRLIMSVSKDRR